MEPMISVDGYYSLTDPNVTDILSGYSNPSYVVPDWDKGVR
jgi:hypothetical protein